MSAWAESSCITSAMLAVAVPSLLTTTPAAALAMCIAWASVRPLATARASVAITVSPAPETSNTSRARAGPVVTSPVRSTRVMPRSERVTSMASAAQSSSRSRAAVAISSSVPHGPRAAAANSFRLGVMQVAPR